MKKVNNVISINTSTQSNFFKYWLDFLKPFHKLTERETTILAAFLKQYYILSDKIKDETILDKVLLGEDTRKKIREECNISQSHFQVVLSKFKAKGIIVDNKLNRKFVPNLKNNDNSFQLLLLFNLTN